MDYSGTALASHISCMIFQRDVLGKNSIACLTDRSHLFPVNLLAVVSFNYVKFVAKSSKSVLHFCAEWIKSNGKSVIATKHLNFDRMSERTSLQFIVLLSIFCFSPYTT